MSRCKKVFFQTLGCKVNHYESEAMGKLFEAAGWSIAEDISEAEVVVVNTCTVTAVSSQKSRQMIRRASSVKPNAVLVVVGCYAQSEPEVIAQIEGVDVIIGTRDRTRVVELVETALQRRGELIQMVGDVEDIRAFEELPHTPHRTRAFLKIEDGCNNFCSYCIIPYVRGRVRSRSLESIGEACRGLAASGYKEIVLTGIHIGAYGRDLTGNVTLVDAIKTVLDAANPLRLRLGSIESNEFTDELIDLLRNDARLCNHVHVPLQAGSDEILRAMRRPYTTKNFAELTARLATIPNVSIGTDLIVGFPGETAAHFDETLAFIREQPFSKIHVFPYSARLGTLAATLPNQIPPPIKKVRAGLALEVSRLKASDFASRLLGETVEIIAETSTGGVVDGLTKNYVRVYVPDEGIEPGEVVRVKVERLHEDGVFGTVD